ncbi:Jacalin-related lectin 19 [Euphorbia peplus]|nr:Jacalin-related lectin 19 [Euphorbia peplus]
MDYSKEGSKDQSIVKKKSILVGPWGGNGGNPWDDGIYNGVREITILYDRCIDSIQLVYDKNGKPVTSEKHGGIGGTKSTEIKLQFPEEFLVSASGHYSPVVYGGSPVIRSITFKSNKRTFGPYGFEEGTPFTLSMDGCSIVGFMGRGGWYLDAIGFRLSRSQSTKPLQKVRQRLQRLTSSVGKSSPSAKDPEKAY